MVWRWSKTAANNANSDATINWAEGMPPSAVNDSARAEMARVAQYRDDTAGAIATTGTSSAYLVSSNQVFDTLAHMDGAMVAFSPHAGNSDSPTLNVDGLGAKPLRAAPGQGLPSSALVLGTPYVATYYNAAGEWILHGGSGNAYGVPLGGMIDYTGATAPSSAFVLPFGQALSRTAYANYFALVGTTFGAGDGSTSFNVVDLRGRVTAGADNLGGTSAGRLPGFTTWAVGGESAHTLSTPELPAQSYSLAGAAGTALSTDVSIVTSPLGTTASLVAPIGSSPVGFGFTAATFKGQQTSSFTPAGTIGPIGSSSAHNNVQPTLAVSKILRVL